MRAALLLVILSLPALARGQAVGAVEPVPGDDRYATDRFVSLAECSSTTSTIELRWTMRFASADARSGAFRVFASNNEPTSDTSGGVIKCPTVDNPNENLRAGPITADNADIPSGITNASGSGDVLASLVVSAAGYTCAEATDRVVYVCVNFFPYDTGTQDPQAEPVAHAVGTLTIQTRAPAAPTLESVSPGNERLHARFSAGSGGAVPADRFRITATAVPPATGGSSRDVDRSPDFVGGLVNEQPYTVTVQALSTAGNPSAASSGIVGTPLPGEDFWDRYQGRGGTEEGGCGGGPAGPLSLLGLAAAFALARPRARRRS
jgi:hypothetical protein